MGLFDFLRSKNSMDSKGDSETELPRLKRKESAYRAIPQTGTYTEVEIVGESFHQEAFKFLREELGLSARGEASVEVELVNEPENPNERSGKAVAVFVMNQKVGHVSSYTCQFVFDDLLKTGGRKKFKGRIYFGDMRENPPKNSVAISYSVQTKTPEETQKSEEKYQKVQDKRHQAEIAMKEFLQSPVWSKHKLVDGDQVTFTGFDQYIELEKLAGLILPSEPSSGVHLLVVHPRMLPDSAKLRDWLARGKPVTDLETFLEHNPEFGQYFNRSTGQFDMPESVTGKKKKKAEPPKATITFESDENFGSDKPLPAEIVLLRQQTLAKYPTRTLFGSFNWRLTDLKDFQDQIQKLFDEIGGTKTDAILLKGRLQELDLNGEVRLAFKFRDQIVGLVPKNETQSMIRDGKSWKEFPTIAIVSLDYKGVLRGAHDAGLIERFRK